jgi:hypothetical protein
MEIGGCRVTGDDARDKIGALLGRQLQLLEGLDGLVSADQAQAIEHLAGAHSMYVEAEDYE